MFRRPSTRLRTEPLEVRCNLSAVAPLSDGFAVDNKAAVLSHDAAIDDVDDTIVGSGFSGHVKVGNGHVKVFDGRTVNGLTPQSDLLHAQATDAAFDDFDADGATEANSGYIRIKKLNSGG